MQSTRKVTKVEDWKQRLDQYINLMKGSQYQWGSVDCLCFALNALNAMSNSSVFGPPESYLNELESTNVLMRYLISNTIMIDQYGPLYAAVDHYLLSMGLERVDGEKTLEDGDICIVNGYYGPACAVRYCDGYVALADKVKWFKNNFEVLGAYRLCLQ